MRKIIITALLLHYAVLAEKAEATTTRPPSTTSYPWDTTTTSYPADTTTSRPPSTTSYPWDTTTTSYPSDTTTSRPPSTTSYPWDTTTTSYPSDTTTSRPPSTTSYPWDTTTSRPPSTTSYPWDTTTSRPPSTTSYPWYTTSSRPPSTTGYPWDTTTSRPPTTTYYPWTTTRPLTTTPYHPYIQYVEARIEDSTYTFLRVDEYDRITFHCQVTGGQDNNYTWERRDYGNPTWHYFEEGQHITFTAYVGVYRCTAKNYYNQVVSRNEIAIDIACLDNNGKTAGTKITPML